MTNTIKPKTVSLEWYYRDENYNGSDIGRAMKKVLEQIGRTVGEKPQSSFDTCSFHYGNATVELVPDHHHYVYLTIHSNDKNSCKSALEEIISNAERILIKENGKRYPLEYPKNFRIPRNKTEALRSVSHYRDLKYHFGLKMTQN